MPWPFWRCSSLSSATLAGDGHEDPRLDRPGPVELRGRIDGAMMRRLIDAVNAGHKDFFINGSFGGSVFSAAAMAGLIKSSGASLTVNGVCYSACALLVIGAGRKYYTPDADIRIHGARNTRPVAGQDDDAPARSAANYMVQNGVPRDIAYGPGMGINLYRLSPQELARIGIAWRSAES